MVALDVSPPTPHGLSVRAAVPSLVVVTDRELAAGHGQDVVDVVAACAGAGAPAILVREKDLPPPAREDLLRRIAQTFPEDGNVLLLVAGDVELALRVGAGGVHLAARDAWPSAAALSTGERRLIVGRSCHSTDDLLVAAARGADYATLSPIFETPSKPGYGPPLGVDVLADASGRVPGLAVLALGGIAPGRAAECLAAGARGVAVMGEVMRAADPAATVRELVAEVSIVARPADEPEVEQP